MVNRHGTPLDERGYFQGMNFGGQNLPISTQQVVLFAGIQIPVGW